MKLIDIKTDLKSSYVVYKDDRSITIVSKNVNGFVPKITFKAKEDIIGTTISPMINHIDIKPDKNVIVLYKGHNNSSYIDVPEDATVTFGEDNKEGTNIINIDIIK